MLPSLGIQLRATNFGVDICGSKPHKDFFLLTLSRYAESRPKPTDWEQAKQKKISQALKIKQKN